MDRLIHSTFVLLLLLSFTIGGQSDARKKETRVPSEPSGPSDECSRPGRPKPDVVVGLEAGPVLCGRAISLPKPSYPEEAKAKKISGVVRVNIVIDEEGRVIWAEAVEGHQLLRDAAVKAACLSKHSPIKISGRVVKTGSAISYNFVSQ